MKKFKGLVAGLAAAIVGVAFSTGVFAEELDKNDVALKLSEGIGKYIKDCVIEEGYYYDGEGGRILDTLEVSLGAGGNSIQRSGDDVIKSIKISYSSYIAERNGVSEQEYIESCLLESNTATNKIMNKKYVSICVPMGYGMEEYAGEKGINNIEIVLDGSKLYCDEMQDTFGEDIVINVDMGAEWNSGVIRVDENYVLRGQIKVNKWSGKEIRVIAVKYDEEGAINDACVKDIEKIIEVGSEDALWEYDDDAWEKEECIALTYRGEQSDSNIEYTIG